jgi:hypothetical protein
VHEAFTSEAASLHLTVGVNVYRWADLLGEALTALTREDQRFREAVPRDVLGPSGLTLAVRERFTELVEALAARADVEDAAAKLGDQFFGQLLSLPGQGFAPPDTDENVELDTVLERMQGLIFRVVSQGGWVSLEYPGGELGGPLKIASSLRFAAETERFPVRDMPDDLSGDAKLVLARRLVRERLFRVADPTPKGPGSGSMRAGATSK